LEAFGPRFGPAWENAVGPKKTQKKQGVSGFGPKGPRFLRYPAESKKKPASFFGGRKNNTQNTMRKNVVFFLGLLGPLGPSRPTPPNKQQ
jgi:hypothetical protein